MKKKLTVLTLCLLMLFSTATPVYACSDLKDFMLPKSVSAYPTSGDWEPAKLGYFTSSKKATKSHTETTNWKTVHSDYLYKVSKNGKKTTYTTYRRSHLEKYRSIYTKGSKKYQKDVKVKVTLTKMGSSNKKPARYYTKW